MNNTNKKQSKNIKSPVFVWETTIIRKGKKHWAPNFVGLSVTKEMSRSGVSEVIF